MKILDWFKPNSKFVPAGTDPLARPVRPRGGGKAKWWQFALLGGCVILIIAGGFESMKRYLGWFGGTSTPEAKFTATLPNPGVAFEGSATADANADTLASLLLTTGTVTITPTASATNWTLLTPTPSASPTACTATHWQTSVVCDTLAITATLEAAGVGTAVNVSGVDPAVTTVYIYPTDPPTPWIITASPTWTPIVITATPGPTQTERVVYYTAQPGPTQTPWFYITQPPVVTVVWTQIVTVEITREVTVVVTATSGPPTETPQPTETPAP